MCVGKASRLLQLEFKPTSWEAPPEAGEERKSRLTSETLQNAGVCLPASHSGAVTVTCADLAELDDDEESKINPCSFGVDNRVSCQACLLSMHGELLFEGASPSWET